jgi:DNA-binding MarR family transcriptional regulator
MSNSPTALAKPGPKDNVLALCHMLSNRIGKAFYQELDKFGISVAEWRVILTLALHEKASSREITNRWAMDKMAVSRAVSRLEEQGLIEKRQNNRDKRSYDLTMTDAGREMYEKILPAANTHYRKLVTGLGRSELTAFRNTMIKLIMQADEYID